MKDKTIVITGASAGIGAALARLCGARGAHVVLAARRGGELAAVAEDAGPDALAVEADLTNRHDAERVRDEAVRVFERVDVWVNNVGRGIVRPVMALTDEDLDAMIDVNVRSALYGMQSIVPHFQQRGDGHLINVSSFLGKIPLAPVRSAYSAAKAMLASLTASMRMDLLRSHPNVHVSLIVPGVVTTDFGKHALGMPPDVPFTLAPGTPSQTADEVAAVIAEVIDHPVAERLTNPAQQEVWLRYAADPAAVEAMLTRSR
jgi:short-subunit dehydrogenase